jgi:RHH-type rel operon transcriptional repressor/antitoxin RelB
MEKDMESRLEILSKATGRSKSHYAKQAIREFLEDKQDYLMALASLEKSKKAYTLEEAAKILGVEV